MRFIVAAKIPSLQKERKHHLVNSKASFDRFPSGRSARPVHAATTQEKYGIHVALGVPPVVHTNVRFWPKQQSGPASNSPLSTLPACKPDNTASGLITATLA
jgi:hypothetical protein